MCGVRAPPNGAKGWPGGSLSLCCAVLGEGRGMCYSTATTATTVCDVTFDTCLLHPSISLSHILLCSVLLSWLSDFELPPLRIPLPTLHCDHGDCVSSERLAATKTKGEWMEAQTMAGLGTSACSGGCSDTGVTVKSWCRIALEPWISGGERRGAES
jgi:hypothetical protein